MRKERDGFSTLIQTLDLVRSDHLKMTELLQVRLRERREGDGKRERG